MYDKPENKQLSRREKVLLDPLGASNKSLKKSKEEAKEGSFYGYNENNDRYVPRLDD